MIVVSDSTPLITLMKAMRLDLLKGLYGEVILPDAVFREVTTNVNFSDEAELIKNSGFIKAVSVGDSSKVDYLQRVTGLDRGESEAIIYADEVKADLLLMDEIAGRKVAQNMNIPMTGSLGVLIRAYQEKLISIDEADRAISKIRSANRHISEKLLQSALRQIHG